MIGEAYLTDVQSRLVSLKKLADDALKQADADFFTVSGPEDNSLAIMVKHMSGNMVSRWGNLSKDGESETRNRDAEFVISESREDLLTRWETGWDTLFRALDSLNPDKLLETLTIRGEAHTVLQAINRQLSHYAYHVGQMVFLAKHFQGEAWESLSIPRGESAAFNREMMEKDGTV